MENQTWSRRKFLEFLGVSSVTVAGASLIPGFFAGCASKEKSLAQGKAISSLGFTPVSPSFEDKLLTASGIQSEVLIKWNDVIGNHGSSKPLRFGTNNDYLAFLPFEATKPDDGMLMVNHETFKPLFISGHSSSSGITKTKSQVDTEMDCVGTSLLHFRREQGKWKVDTQSPKNRRFTGKSEIRIAAPRAIEGKTKAIGTFANCAGGVTPWKTFLTCEENYDGFYGDVEFLPKKKQVFNSGDYGWSKFYNHSPLHYGWVVEINPWTYEAKKLTALGRFFHECATCVLAKDGRTVVYMGDDAANEHLYKFISDKPNSLETGTLYVANLEKKKWLPLKMEAHPQFQKMFRDQTELLIRTREAAKIYEATPLDRPEDIEINPANGDVIVALTNNKKANRPHGSLLRVQEKNGDHLSLEFESSTLISGGPEVGLSSPDNLVFDPSGNLWVTTDRPEGMDAGSPYHPFKNNGLYYIPMHGPQAGEVFQVLSGPIDSEITGPLFLPDGETMLICVQHPGQETKDLKTPTSTWPDGPGQLPKSAVVALSGPTLKAMMNYKG